ncbi:glutamate ABC transporter substrate-binding protein [Wenjunlia tyrosinilytica]|jgi:glutamate transport system substrate-binding protein|uniref:ABC transporter substrate-binding protein n=1 Tax=Wenjunlia tyrosinilytica TaxID=1544741 RepID=A0A918DZI1_9ACTN|nr:glutamate ABC transporter substrate-binding protein [Wenjunlia tyrosinilytica]GGO90180.1 ABC transporter substrate-binding protein [Wenjunlia tyrosinilytica]
MNHRRTVLVACAAAATILTGACGQDSAPKESVSAQPSDTPEPPTYKVKASVKTAGSPVLQRIKGGTITIGTKADQPGLSYVDPATGKRSGFDIEIARMIAADLGFDNDHIRWKSVPTGDRETEIANGGVDLYVGTYTINDARKKVVAFAGPYYIAGQDLLVRRNSDINGPQSLRGRRVCSAVGSTSLERVKTEYGVTDADGRQGYQVCVKDLLAGKVDAVTTDDAILTGYLAEAPGKMRLVGIPFTEEPYGVGLMKGDHVLRAAVNAALEAHEINGDWQQAYDATLGLSGVPAPEVPPIDHH